MGTTRTATGTLVEGDATSVNADGVTLALRVGDDGVFMLLYVAGAATGRYAYRADREPIALIVREQERPTALPSLRVVAGLQAFALFQVATTPARHTHRVTLGALTITRDSAAGSRIGAVRPRHVRDLFVGHRGAYVGPGSFTLVRADAAGSDGAGG